MVGKGDAARPDMGFKAVILNGHVNSEYTDDPKVPADLRGGRSARHSDLSPSARTVQGTHRSAAGAWLRRRGVRLRRRHGTAFAAPHRHGRVRSLPEAQVHRRTRRRGAAVLGLSIGLHACGGHPLGPLRFLEASANCRSPATSSAISTSPSQASRGSPRSSSASRRWESIASCTPWTIPISTTPTRWRPRTP